MGTFRVGTAMTIDTRVCIKEKESLDFQALKGRPLAEDKIHLPFNGAAEKRTNKTTGDLQIRI